MRMTAMKFAKLHRSLSLCPITMEIPVPYSSLAKPILKEMCRERNLGIGGTKEFMVARLEAHDSGMARSMERNAVPEVPEVPEMQDSNSNKGNVANAANAQTEEPELPEELEGPQENPFKKKKKHEPHENPFNPFKKTKQELEHEKQQHRRILEQVKNCFRDSQVDKTKKSTDIEHMNTKKQDEDEEPASTARLEPDPKVAVSSTDATTSMVESVDHCGRCMSKLSCGLCQLCHEAGYNQSRDHAVVSASCFSSRQVVTEPLPSHLRI